MSFRAGWGSSHEENMLASDEMGKMRFDAVIGASHVAVLSALFEQGCAEGYLRIGAVCSNLIFRSGKLFKVEGR